MSLRILHQRASAGSSVKQRLGPYEIESLIPPEDEAAGTVYRVCIEPNQTTSTSYHKIAEEFYYVLSGSGTALLNDKSYELHTGDFLRLPPGTTHAFITRDEPLVMLDIHTPGSRPDHDVFFVGETPEGFGAGNQSTVNGQQ
jgi:mannose-6-phosphate isomerase-like protein (cupin superfamily)